MALVNVQQSWSDMGLGQDIGTVDRFYGIVRIHGIASFTFYYHNAKGPALPALNIKTLILRFNQAKVSVAAAIDNICLVGFGIDKHKEIMFQKVHLQHCLVR